MEKICKNEYKSDPVENDIIEKLFEYKYTSNKTWDEVAREIGYTRDYISKIIKNSSPLPRMCKEKLKWFLHQKK